MLPDPAVPQRNLPGLDLAWLSSSRRLLAGKSLRPVMTIETEAIVEMGVKSRKVEYANDGFAIGLMHSEPKSPKIQRRLGLIFASGREPTAAARILAKVIQNTVLSQNFSTPLGVFKVT